MRNVLTASLALLAVGCSQSSAEPVAVAATGACGPFNYGHNVFQFTCTGPEFGEALTNFKASYPELEVTAIVGVRGVGDLDHDAGYIVNAEPRD